MNDKLELLLRDTFDDLAQDAPAAVGLAAGARARQRQRRRALGGALAVAATVAAVAGIAWAVPGTPPVPAPAPAATGDTRVVPEPAPRSEYCAAGTDCEQQRVIDGLRRPLHLPAVAPGGACPVSASHTLPAGAGFNTEYPAIGEGPMRLTGPGTVEFEHPPAPGSGYENTGWGGQKVIWSIDAAYTGPVLLRGDRIDGAGELRFDHYLSALGSQGAGGTAYPELAYPALEGVRFVRTHPSALRMQVPGCYAVQVDGTTFSEIIVFRAELRHQATP
jgi:hypothetical protein